MINQILDTLYKYFVEIYESFIQKKEKKTINKYDECNDEEYLYFNQEDSLMYLNKSI